MDWIALSIFSAASFAIVSVLEKVIISRYSPSPSVFIIFTGVLQIPPGLVVLLFYPLQPDVSLMSWFIAFASGFTWGMSLVLMFWIMSREEVSRVLPVIGMSPVLVAILAMVFLNESLSPMHWLAIAVTVGGAIFISIRLNGGDGKPIIGASFFYLLLAAALVAVGQFLSKVSLEEVNFWNVFTLRSFGLGLACMVFPLRPSIIGDFRELFKNKVGTWLIVFTEGPLVVVSVVLTLGGIALGPVSLATTLMSTRPMFVFAMSTILSIGYFSILDERIESRILLQKGIAIAMIIGGVTVISIL